VVDDQFLGEGGDDEVAGRQIVGKPVADALPEVRGQGFIELLDGVYRSGEAYLGMGVKVKLQRADEAQAQERVLDFVYQPMRNAAGDVDGVFVLATDVTERARAESALRITNWQLGEERARLAALIEAEQRAQQALHRLNETLEAHVKSRTAELTRALAAQQDVADRLRATFATDLIFQGFVDPDGTLLDANPVSLAAIGKPLADVVGRPLWDTEWFSETPGMGARMHDAVAAAARGETVRFELQLSLPGGLRTFLFSLRPVFNGKGEVVGLVPEALEIPDAAEKLAA
jgi:PAS domain-containing protein